MKWRRFIASAMLCVVLALSGVARGATSDEDAATHDGRTEGYKTSVQLPSSSTGMTWVIFFFLSLVCLGVLFKDSKRARVD